MNRLAYRWHSPSRGDVVAFWNGREVLVKRIVGLPGEEISVKSGQFIINGEPLQESYAWYHPPLNINPGTLQPDTFALAGDNRAATTIFIVSKSRIIGRVLY